MSTGACRAFGQNSVDEVDRLLFVFNNGRRPSVVQTNCETPRFANQGLNVVRIEA
jgi:hypothetical protein